MFMMLCVFTVLYEKEWTKWCGEVVANCWGFSSHVGALIHMWEPQFESDFSKYSGKLQSSMWTDHDQTVSNVILTEHN